MRILVTGANGFIGSSIVNTLSKKYNIIPLTRDVCDLLDSDQVNAFFDNNLRFDCVIHCASVGGGRFQENLPMYSDCNLKMFGNLLNNRNHYNQFITFSSGAEDDRYQFYGCSKKSISTICECLDNFYVLKIYGLFGIGELETRFPTICIRNCLENKPISVDSKQMDYFYIDDLIELICYYMFAPKSKLKKKINCVYDEKVNLEYIANLIKLYLGSDSNIKFSGRSPGDYICRKKEKFGFRLTGLEAGLKKMCDQFKLNV